MSFGVGQGLSAVPMMTQGRPIGGSDGTYLRTLYVGPDGSIKVTTAKALYTPVAVPVQSAANTVYAGSGSLLSALVTTSGTAAMTFYDNALAASGTVIGYIPANAPVGQTYTFSMPFQSGITASGNANNPAVTLSVSNSQSTSGPAPSGSTTYPIAVPVQAGAYVASAVAATLNQLLVTVAGTVAMKVYDNASAASGTVIAVIPANTPAGTPIPVGMAAANGLTFSGSASNPAVTASVTVAFSPKNVAVPVQAGVYVAKGAPGFLASAVVTVAGTVAMTIYDNASAGSGTVIGYIPANAPVGMTFAFNMPAANGITCSGSASNPTVTLSIQ